MIWGLVLLLFSSLTCTLATPRHAHRMFQHMELDIRDKIVLDLGMNNIPDMAHANVSSEEFDKMYKVYLQSAHQTAAMKDLRSVYTHCHWWFCHLTYNIADLILMHTSMIKLLRDG